MRMTYVERKSNRAITKFYTTIEFYAMPLVFWFAKQNEIFEQKLIKQIRKLVNYQNQEYANEIHKTRIG